VHSQLKLEGEATATVGYSVKFTG